MKETYQRRGYGRRVVDYVCMWLASRGVQQVMLNVDVDNTAGAQFWQQQEFRPILLRMKRSL
ncbi:MAG: GNAT family N-acetyltransferase [Caldilineaceae bacterium]